MSSGLLFGTNSIFAKIDNFTSFGLDRKLDDMLGLTPPEIKGPRLSDLTVQTSTYGAHIPRLYGTISVMGNVIWLENGRYKETVRKKKSGGKGGGGSSEPTTTYSYSATFHLSLCEGPIAGIRRMWCGDKLLYNAGSDDLETIIASNKAAAGWKLYLGSDSQLPDSRYEANVGVGNASAHRGMAYIAFYDFQLADYSNALQGAQFKVEVVSSLSSSDALMFSYAKSVPSLPAGPLASAPKPSNTYGPTLESYFTTFSGGTNGFGGLYRFNKNGSRSEIDYSAEASPISPTEAFRPVPVLSSDTMQGCFFQDTGDRDHIYIRQSGGTKYYQGSILVELNKFIVERAGFFWLRYGLSGGYSLSVLNFTEGGDTLDGQIVAGATIPFSASECVAGLGDGRLAGCAFSMVSPANSASVSISLLSQSLALIQTDTFTINRPANTLGHDFLSVNSFAYVADNSVMYVVLIEDTSGVEFESGRFFYFAFDTVNRKIVSDMQALYHPTKSSFHPDLVAVKDGILIAGDGVSGTYECALTAYGVGIQGSQTVQLSSIINDEVGRSALIGELDLSATALTDGVRGYRVSGGTARSNLEPLQAAFHFDVRPHGYQIQFLPRGQASVVTIPWEDLGATDGGTPKDILQQSREMDPQLPARTVVKYLDAAREYAIGEQSSERLNTESVNKVDRELALVLTADEAAGVAEVLNFLPWLERTDAAFTLPPSYRYLEPGDVVTVIAPTAAYELRLTEIGETQDGRLECKALPSRAALYTPAATGAEGVPPIGTIGLAGESLFVPLDIPVIDETLQDAPGFVGVMTGYFDAWPGGIVVRSSDDGQTWADLQAYTGKATLGTARDTLPASDCTLIDQRTLTVDLISGELDSVTRDQMLVGVNYAAYGINGRWEIVRFQNAPMQSDGSNLLSGFLRGEKGTEWAAGLHVAGDYFVLLDDPDNAFIGSSVESILAPRLYRGVTSGGSLDDAADVPFTYKGVNLECLSPVYAKGTRDGSSNFTGAFTRRSRLSSSWWATGVVAPIGEASESYAIDVMSGATVKRTITAVTPSFAYSAANQVADFGSAQASITFRIFQLSATVGRGYPLEVTL